MRLRIPVFIFALVLSFAFAKPVLAEDFQCEILSLKGTVTIRDKDDVAHPAKQAELLKAGDEVEVGDESYVDLAYDKDWQNITRLESNSKVTIASIAPGKLDLKAGGVFAKLKKLPQNSSFEIKTPTAVATVRGSEYRTTYIFGQTDVFNAASSRVVVYGVKEDGAVDKDTAVMIEKDNKTSVEKAGMAPKPAELMSDGEIKSGQSLQKGIETNVTQAKKEGREAQVQSVTQIEEFIRDEKRKAATAGASAKPDELSRVTDSRRRPFGGDREMAPPQEEEKEQPAPPKKAPASE